MDEKDFLLEIGTEEIPARFMLGILKDFEKKATKWLESLNISFESIKTYGTPRRMVLYITKLAEKQLDQDILVKGPSKKVAFNDNVITNAGLGFAKSQGVEPEQLEVRSTENGEYVYVVKHIKGVNTIELLHSVKDIILDLHFPKNMRWGDYDLKFVRPIKWILCLYGQQIVPFTITDQASSNKTYGHRFLSKNEIIVDQPANYFQLLLDEFVIVNQSHREQEILKELKNIESEYNVKIPIDKDLLEEIVYLVEYPTALIGSFDEQFLLIPNEVLITSMKEHQRYFPVLNLDNQLQARFVTIRNGDDRSIDTVRKGNEKVLRARLADARFFYDEDKKIPIETFNEKLKNIIYHVELGTIADKVDRVTNISNQISGLFKMNSEDTEHILRIASLSKFDLVTHMVYEFPELQGFMGREYALIAGEDKEVADGLFECYLPRFAGDDIPKSLNSSIVSIADKIDTIVGCIGIGIIPTGSQDPYALRRQATGICQIIKGNLLELPLGTLIDISIGVLNEKKLFKKDIEILRQEVVDFFMLRVKNILQDEEIRYDIIDASISSTNNNLLDILNKAQSLQDALQYTWFNGVIDSFNRIKNITSNVSTDFSTDKSLFIEEVEHELYVAYSNNRNIFVGAVKSRDYKYAISIINVIKPLIDKYFDKVMVMDKNINIKNNRLAFLQEFYQTLSLVGDLSKIINK
jgi:glycyl-tRNA synthetase beta chain